MANLSLSTESISTLNSDSNGSEGEPQHLSRSLSITSDDSHASQRAGDFIHDAAASILDSLQKGDESANMQLELTALRMSTNASEHQVRRAVVIAFMKRISQLVESGTGVKQAVNEVMGEHQTLLERTMFDKSKSGKVDQVDFLLLTQQDVARRRDGESILLFVSNELYDMDIIQAEGFEQWWSDVKSSESDEMKRVRSKMQQFIDIVTAEESEDEDEEDEEQESSDEE